MLFEIMMCWISGKLDYVYACFFFFSSRRRHTRYIGDWSSDVCSSDLHDQEGVPESLPAITGREDAWRREAEVCHDILHCSLAAQKKSLTVIGHHPQDEGLRPRGRCSCQAKCISNLRSVALGARHMRAQGCGAC